MTRKSSTPIGITVALLLLVAGTIVGCAAGVPTAPPTPAPSSTAARTVGDDVLLPNENERSTSPEFTDWTTDTAIGRAWLLDPCRPTAYPTDAERVRFRTVARTGPEAHDARQLAEYPTAQIATEAFAGFRRALAACGNGTDRANGTTWEWVVADVPALGEDGFLAASTYGGGPDHSPYGDRIAVTRTGSMVFLVFASAEFSSADIDGGAFAAQQVAQAFLDSL